VRSNQTVLRTSESIRRGLAPFFRWWVDELAGIVPGPLRRLVSGPGRRIVVAMHPRLQFPARTATSNCGELLAGLHVLEERGGQLRSIGPSCVTAEPHGPETSALAELAKSTRRVPIGIRLPFDACFARRIALPAGARNDFRNILSLDLERATPFRAGDVYASHYVEDPVAESGKLKVRQLVVKRTTLDPVIAEIQALGVRVSFADCWDKDGRTALPVNFLEPSPDIASPFGKQLRPTGLLVGLALLLACSAMFLFVHKHDRALEQVQKELVHAKGEAQNVRRRLDRAEAALAEVASLRRMKLESIPVVQTLEDLSRLMPDSAWLTELRIDGDTVEFSGLAKSAVDLLPLVERSAQFVDATLAAPLTFDPREDKERFSVRLRIRLQTPEHTASRAGKSG
jgi:general secretion pathway protein L